MQRPTRANRAITLLWVGFVLAAFAVVLPFGNVAELPFAWMFVGIIVVLFTANGLLIWFAGRGRNWARIVLVLFVLLSVPSLFLSDWPENVLEWLATAADWLSSTLEGIAMYLLFSREASAWFKANPEELDGAL